MIKCTNENSGKCFDFGVSCRIRSSRVETSLKDGCKIYRAIHFSTVRVCEEMFTPTLTRFLPSSNL